MPSPTVPEHPPEFRRLCEQAVERLRALAAAPPLERGPLIPGIRALLEQIDREIDERDIRDPGFATEQGLLVDASSALQSIDLDRGGPHVSRFVDRAIADIRRVSGE